MSDAAASTRAQRRARTRSAILGAARQEFSQSGYQRATIRAVADRAGCDPSLVMQHFGSKQELFRAAVQLDLDMAAVAAGPAEELSERMIRAVLERMDERPEATASTFRSMLTHDGSAEEALKLFNVAAITQDSRVSGAFDDESSELRGQLVGALTLGVAITRYVLKASAVEQASIDDLVAHLRPVVEVLLPGISAEGLSED